MKKIFVMLCMLLCLVMSVPALAQVELVNENVGNVSWISGTDLFCAKGDTGSCIMTMDGAVLTDAVYDRFIYRMGWIEAVSVNGGMNCLGLLGQDGSIAMPFEYGAIDVLDENWACGVVLIEGTEEEHDYTGWSGGYYIGQRYDIYYLPGAVKVAEYAGADFGGAAAVNGVLNIGDAAGSVTSYDASFSVLGSVSSIYSDEYSPDPYETYTEGDLYGIADAAGSVVVNAAYEDAYVCPGNEYALVTGENGTGLLKLDTAELVVAAEYTEVLEMDCQASAPAGYYAYKCMGYYCVDADGMLGYVNAAGEVTCTPRHSIDDVDVNGVSYIFETEDDRVLLVSADGTETDVSAYDDVDAFDNGRGMYYAVYNDAYDMAVIDWHGNIVIDFAEDQYVSMSGSGMYLLAGSAGDGFALYRISYPE